MLNDMLKGDGGCDSAGKAKIRSASKKFSDYFPIFCGKAFSLKLKD